MIGNLIGSKRIKIKLSVDVSQRAGSGAAPRWGSGQRAEKKIDLRYTNASRNVALRATIRSCNISSIFFVIFSVCTVSLCYASFSRPSRGYLAG